MRVIILTIILFFFNFDLILSIDKPIKEDNDILIDISAVGDIMIHSSQLDAQYDINSKKYNFYNNFKYISDDIKKSDLSIANLETTFSGEENGYSGYPRFNSPDSLAHALKKSGFDFISIANNHTLDYGIQGFERTIGVLEKNKLNPLGIKKDLDDKRYEIKDIKGVKVGIIAYTYETPPIDGSKTINNIKIPNEIKDLINTFNPNNLTYEIPKIQSEIQNMKKDGAELIVFVMHWGNEYNLKPNYIQKVLAKCLANSGVDIILGSHPHVIQPVELINSNNSNHKTVIVYSMGNFLSNQRFEMTGSTYTENGVILNIEVRKNLTTKKVSVDKVSYKPTWVYKYYNNDEDKIVYEIIPVLECLKNYGKFKIYDSETQTRIQKSFKNTNRVIKSKY
ncbi:MAG TPA: CapA family protein [Peptostreptococcaceae bacterium]|nr:CapA family protein [Peptostreptococcaceae bacterium]